jgi:hypothetical protein
MVAARIALRAATAGGLAVAIALAFLNHTARAADEGVTITSLSQQVGETGTVTLGAANIDVPPLGAWEIDVTYDNSVLTPVECLPEGASSFCNLEFGEDQIRLVGANPTGIRGETAALARVRFTCNAEGSSLLTPTVNTFADTNGFEIPVTVQDAQADCLAPGESLTPASGSTDEPRPDQDTSSDGGNVLLLTAILVGALGILVVGGISWRAFFARK